MSQDNFWISNTHLKKINLSIGQIHCSLISLVVQVKEIPAFGAQISLILCVSVHRICAKNYTRKLMWWMRSAMTSMLK